jgi:hypothetical protein
MQVSLTRPRAATSRARRHRPGRTPKFAPSATRRAGLLDVALYGDAQFTLRGGDDAERVRRRARGRALPPTLGRAPRARPRDSRREEDRAGERRAGRRAGDALWRRRFGADPAVVGRAVPWTASRSP